MDKCANCKKPRDQHNATTKACPIGRKHRTFGYLHFKHLKGIESDLKSIYKRSFDKPKIYGCYLYDGEPIIILKENPKDKWDYAKVNEDGSLGKTGICSGYDLSEEIYRKLTIEVIVDKKYFIKF